MHPALSSMSPECTCCDQTVNHHVLRTLPAVQLGISNAICKGVQGSWRGVRCTMSYCMHSKSALMQQPVLFHLHSLHTYHSSSAQFAPGSGTKDICVTLLIIKWLVNILQHGCSSIHRDQCLTESVYWY